MNTIAPSSSTNHTGITCGEPSAIVVASFAVRVPVARNARTSCAVSDLDIVGREPTSIR